MSNVTQLTPKDYVPPTTNSKDFAVVSREILMTLLESIMTREGDTDWARDAARKIHFGLVHHMGHVADLVGQAKEEEREAFRLEIEGLQSDVRDNPGDYTAASILTRLRLRLTERSSPSGGESE